MADVTRYATSQRVIFAVPADYVEDSPEGVIVITEADHLAALERGRVETLREARRACGRRCDSPARLRDHEEPGAGSLTHPWTSSTPIISVRKAQLEA